MPVKTKPQTRATLTDQQRRFCEAYLKEPNGTKAAIKAGYKKTTARFQAARLLTKANVKAELARLRAVREAKTTTDAAFVIEGLRLEALGKGPDTAPGARVQAYKLLGQHLGMFRDEQPVVVMQPPPTDVPTTQAEKMAAIERLIKIAQERMAAGQLPVAQTPTEQPPAG